jgi:hypothetical protein
MNEFSKPRRRGLFQCGRKRGVGRGMVGALLMAGSLACTQASAQELRNFITDLYGGNGITLDRFGAFPHDAHFTANSVAALGNLNSALTRNLGVFGARSTTAGYTFDIAKGVPVRADQNLGSLLAERATTIGKGRFGFGFSYTHVHYTQYEGRDLDNLKLVFKHDDILGPGFSPGPDGILGPPGPAFELNTVNVAINTEVVQNIFALYANYGITDNWSAEIVVPVVHVRARADAVATINGDPNFHRFGRLGDARTSSTGGEEVGIADIILRTKYNFLRGHSYLPDMAVLGQVITPNGDKDKLLGTGEARFSGLLIMSKQYGRFTPHVNAGYELTTGDSVKDSFRYIAGLDVSLHPKITGVVDVLGRWEPDGDGTLDQHDVAVGFKATPIGRVPLSLLVQIPINKDTGLRADTIWSLAAEVAF